MDVVLPVLAYEFQRETYAGFLRHSCRSILDLRGNSGGVIGSLHVLCSLCTENENGEWATALGDAEMNRRRNSITVPMHKSEGITNLIQQGLGNAELYA
jgi:hypothetical protein